VVPLRARPLDRKKRPVPKGWGGTLRTGKGFAQPTRLRLRRTFDRLYAASSAFAAAAAGVMALVLALTGSLSPGVVADDPGGLVLAVDPGGFAWRSGIRPGQSVVSVSAVDDEGGWSIETIDGAVRYRATADVATATLRQSAPVAAGAALLGILALVAVPTRRRRAELLAGFGLGLAALPLWLAEDPLLAAAAGMLAPVSLVVWILRWLEPRRMAVILAGLVVVAIAMVWAGARAVGSPLAADLDGLRLASTAVLATGVLMAALDLTIDRLVHSAGSLRLVDAAAGCAGILAAGIMAVSFAIPLPLVATVTGVAVVAYAGLRTGIARLVDRVLLAEVRERAALQAAEEERARLSRELHDDPLQALAGVIHRLERQPETEDDREALRNVAAHLRDVATELHPPVLDDLGLVSAIEGLPTPESGIGLLVSVSHDGYERAHRPPAQVEIALFRIVQEAVANAIAHSGCRTVRVEGEVGRDQVTLRIVDDGRGVTDNEMEAAMRRGHIGVASMRRRADAIDARLSHLGRPGEGTTVIVKWQA
jgi:signal transduction histidine kinase